jgi:predicted unusual protein kinase regulating ubiquinone biosynthesis (AarF/ABC1/UbiB family)
MALSLRPQHLSRYAQLARLLVKYGRSDMVRTAGLESLLDGEPRESGGGAEPTELVADLERMGPTYVKLGQLLSSRPDLLSAPYIEALSRLQDDVAPFPFAEVREVLTSELGARLSNIFAEMDEAPLAAASLGQTHRARLRDGRRVVVKIQRPGVREQVAADLEVLEELAQFIDGHSEQARNYALPQMFDQFRRSLVDELDYRREAGNLVTLRHILAEHRHLVVPRPLEDFSTTRVLTMEDCAGHKLTELSQVVLLEVDGRALAEDLFAGYLDQVLVEGFFHADPHPGNVLLTPDRKLALVDVGMVARVPHEVRDQLVRMLLALTEARGEEVARAILDISEPMPTFDDGKFRAELAELVQRATQPGAAPLQTGRLVMEITRTCVANGLRPPSEMTMLGKTLLNLDHIALTLDPDFHPLQTLRGQTTRIVRSSVRSTPGSLIAAALETKNFAEQLPGRINRAMDAVGSGQFELKVRAIDETEFLRGLHRMANRVATGLVLAALIVGAAILSLVHSSFRIGGYPGIALVLFLIAAVGGLWLVLSIVVSDRRMRRRR